VAVAVRAGLRQNHPSRSSRRLFDPALSGEGRKARLLGAIAVRVNGASDDPAVEQLAVARLHCLADDARAKAIVRHARLA
jgi:hypothetical protein